MKNDQQLLSAYIHGDDAAFAELYEKYFSKIYNFVFYKVYSQENAEDITADVFHKVIENVDKFNAKKGNFSQWIYSIARNTVVDFFRKRFPTDNIEDIFDAPARDDVEREVSAKISLEKVEKYLRTLKPQQREIIILRVWENLSYKEIALIIGKNESAVKMSFSRIVGKMNPDLLLLYFTLLNT
ncbi:hypothetical protein COB57_01885 [Candidatus Peregrinibacteria bacterium]|nr:MAG: hypothetical protein COB57_01885 [Candidatus Peregrinibacteria bacterium]